MRSKNKSSLFLMELIVAIFFFAASSAVCISIFVGAHRTSSRSVDLNQAVFLAQSAAETVKAYPAQDGWEKLPGLSYLGGDRAEVWYDKDWNPIAGNGEKPPSSAVYQLELLAQGLDSTQVTVKKGEETLFSIEAVHLNREGGESLGQ